MRFIRRGRQDVSGLQTQHVPADDAHRGESKSAPHQVLVRSSSSSATSPQDEIQESCGKTSRSSRLSAVTRIPSRLSAPSARLAQLAIQSDELAAFGRAAPWPPIHGAGPAPRRQQVDDCGTLRGAALCVEGQLSSAGWSAARAPRRLCTKCKLASAVGSTRSRKQTRDPPLPPPPPPLRADSSIRPRVTWRILSSHPIFFSFFPLQGPLSPVPPSPLSFLPPPLPFSSSLFFPPRHSRHLLSNFQAGRCAHAHIPGRPKASVVWGVSSSIFPSSSPGMQRGVSRGVGRYFFA